MNNQSRLMKVISHVILLIVIIVFITPNIILLARSLTLTTENASRVFSIENFTSVLSKPRTSQTFLNGFKISFFQSILVILLGFGSAYVLARIKKKWFKSFQNFILIWIGIPLNFLVIPVYFILQRLKLLNSLYVISVFFAASALPFTISILARQFTSQNEDIEKSAALDGANHLQVFMLIILPNSLRSIITVGLNSFVISWSTFIVPFVLLNSSDKQPVSTTFYEQFSASYGTNFGELSAFAVLYALPVWLIYSVLYTVLNRKMFLKNIVYTEIQIR